MTSSIHKSAGMRLEEARTESRAADDSDHQDLARETPQSATGRRPGKKPHVAHYPLNGLDLRLSHYHHRGIGIADVLASRLLQACLDGTTAEYGLLRRTVPFGALHVDIPPTGGTFARLPPLWQDLQVLNKLLALHSFDELLANHGARPPVDEVAVHFVGRRCRHRRHRVPPRPVLDILMDVLFRLVVETSHPVMEYWLSYWPLGFLPGAGGLCPRGPERYDWQLFRRTGHWLCKDEQQHLRRHRTGQVRNRYPLFSEGPLLHAHRDNMGLDGPHNVTACRMRRLGLGPLNPSPLTDVFPIGPLGGTVELPPYEPPPGYGAGYPGPKRHWRHTQRLFALSFPCTSASRRTGRSSSQPAPGAYAVGSVRRSWDDDGVFYAKAIFFPRPSMSRLLHRYRRRSLSRRHIADMFHVPAAEGGCFGDENEFGRWGQSERKSEVGVVIASSKDEDDDESSPFEQVGVCPLCRKAGHHAERCREVPPSARCKCRPAAQQTHLPRQCPLLCARPCGNDADPPGHPNRHRNAMLCKSRCCMCGLRGHRGRDCRMRTCRCGGAHLGQNCPQTWNPTCRVRGCDRYLCGLHCRECGSNQKPFVGWRCKECLANGRPVGKRADDEASLDVASNGVDYELLGDHHEGGEPTPPPGEEDEDRQVEGELVEYVDDDESQSSRGVMTPDTSSTF